MNNKVKLLLGVAIFFSLLGLFYFYNVENGNENPGNKIPVSQHPDTAIISPRYPDSINFLLIGIDSIDKEESRTDVLMLVNLNLKEKKVNILSIPRDTRVNIKNTGYTKINHAHYLGEIQGGSHSGTLASVRAVESLCNCVIDYYVKVDFYGFKELINLVDGIDIELDQPVFLTRTGATLAANKQHIDGELALEFVRERYSLSGGDFERQRNQCLVLKAFINRILEPANYVKVPTIYRKISSGNIIETNLKESDIVSLALEVKEIPTENVQYFTFPGQDGFAMDPLLNSKLYYWMPNVTEVQQITQRFFASQPVERDNNLQREAKE